MRKFERELDAIEQAYLSYSPYAALNEPMELLDEFLGGQSELADLGTGL
jgi:hypothetical protein